MHRAYFSRSVPTLALIAAVGIPAIASADDLPRLDERRATFGPSVPRLNLGMLAFDAGTTESVAIETVSPVRAGRALLPAPVPRLHLGVSAMERTPGLFDRFRDVNVHGSAQPRSKYPEGPGVVVLRWRDASLLLGVGYDFAPDISVPRRTFVPDGPSSFAL